MDKFFKRHEHWDEFQWEKEIRKDELRISGYFRELASCLDLPGEEELIYDQLSGNQDLVPSPEAAPCQHFNWNDFEDDDNCDDGDDSPTARRPHAGIIEMLDALAVSWSMIYAAKLHSQLHNCGLGIVCAYGKLLARTADFFEPQRDCETALLLSIGKRCLSDLNELAGALMEIRNFQPDIAGEINRHLTLLSEVHDALVTQLEATRSSL